MKCNGRYALHIQTVHGSFVFPNQKFADKAHKSWAFLQASEHFQSGVSQGLEELAVGSCCTCGSYEKARQVLLRVTGQAPNTRQTLGNWVQKTARRMDARLHEDHVAAQAVPLPAVTTAVDLYDATTPEVQVFEDGILVKAQKPTHEKVGQVRREKAVQMHNAYFALAPLPSGRYRFVMGTSDGELSVGSALRDFVRTAWHDTPAPLPIVAITDGEKALRNDLREAFGQPVVLFLDWFHLRKKVCELCSMLVSTRDERVVLKKDVLRCLFRGHVSDALARLAGLDQRNAQAQAKLVTYLTSHTSEIIDYEKRAHAKKTIGSGRMEKGVDQVIGIRQKDNGMSWSKRGSYALGMVTALRANGDWNLLWDTVPIAA